MGLVLLGQTGCRPRPSTSATEGPKRARKSAPKVRTGCLTCKTRHLKCDEEKPICRRCKTDCFTCDGYTPPVSTATSQSNTQKAIILRIPTNLNNNIHGSALEKFYFHHVRDVTIGNLGFSTTHADFWKQVVLPTAHSDDSVRHALVALGMAHRVFIQSPGVEALDRLALQQYNAAIRHLTETRKDDAALTRQTLICCLIFFCLETIMGHYAESLQHLRAGSKLLGALFQQDDSASPKKSKQSEETVQQIADVFAVLGVDVGFFMDENLTPGLIYHSLPSTNDDVLGTPFTGLVDARRHLDAIVVEFNHTVELHRQDWYAPEMCVLYEQFRSWARRFDRTTFKMANEPPSQAEQHELTAMKIARKLWMTVIDHDHKFYPTSNPEFNEAFHSILDEAESFINQLASVPHPVFSLQADTVPPLAYICDLNSDPTIQQRAIDLLRSVKRREGIWDSQEVADYLEDYLLAKKLFQLNWDDIPGGIPGSVRAISKLNLSTMTSCNGIVRLAAQNSQHEIMDALYPYHSIHEGYVKHLCKGEIEI